MSKYGIGALLIYGIYFSMSAQKIVILCTASLIPTKFEQRKTEYCQALEQLTKQPYPIFIVENHLLQGPSFLSDYTTNIVYLGCNNTTLANKGVNEAQAMLGALEQFDFEDDTIIVKVTGRYPFKNFDFLRMIEDNPVYDAFVKYDPHGQVYTGCYAMRCNFMRQMLKQFDFDCMEGEMISIEAAVAQYIKEQLPKSKLCVVKDLGIIANFFGDGSHIITMDL